MTTGIAPKQRGRRARTDVALAMVVAAIVSILLVGGFNLYQGWIFLTEESESQLRSVAAARATRIERGIDSTKRLATTLAADPYVATALSDLNESFAATSATLNPDQQSLLFAKWEPAR